MKLSPSRLATPAAVAAFSALAAAGHACAVCFGNADSDMVQGAKAGVIFLIFVIYGVLMTMAGIAGYWYYRARKLAAAESAPPSAPTQTPQ